MSQDDLELRELEETKARLMQRVSELRDKTLRREQNLLQQPKVIISNVKEFMRNSNGAEERMRKDYKGIKKLCEASHSVLSVRFEDVQKNWLHENVYCWNAEVITKAVQFIVELTVDFKSVDDYEIQDINCHFVNVDESYMIEITPWIQRFTKEKQFSYLMSAISDYSEQSLIRAKILRTIGANGYITLGKCQDEGGGILIYVHPPKEANRIFFKFQWFTKFLDKNWRIEHIFAIDPIQADDEFVKVNNDLLQSFCRVGLRQADLEELWNKMCRIMDNEKK